MWVGVWAECPLSIQGTDTMWNVKDLLCVGCWAQAEDCLRGMSGHWTNSRPPQMQFPSAQPDTSYRVFDRMRGFHFLFHWCRPRSFIFFYLFLIVYMLVYYFLPAALWNSSEIPPARVLKSNFIFPPHNRACCLQPAVNCQQLSEKPGGVVMQRKDKSSACRACFPWKPTCISKGWRSCVGIVQMFETWW